MTKPFVLVALFCALSAASPAWSVTITIDYGTLPVLAGGQVSGPSFATTPMGSNPGVQNYNLTAAGNYSLDFFSNSGADGSDFSFFFNGVGITSVTTNGGGGGPYTMVDGFVSGATSLTLNTNAIVYNANSGQTGNYYSNGSFPAQGNNSGPETFTAIPGVHAVDNLYNAGGGNEDYAFLVDTNGNTLASPGNGGGPTGIPNSEYATFSGNQVNPRSELVHFVLDTNVPMGGLAPTHPILNHVITMGGTHQEFDIRMPIGASGINFSAFGPYTVTGGDAVTPNGTTYVGITGTNDFLFFPTLRFDGLSNGSGYYWLGPAPGPGPGIDNTVSATVVGAFDGGSPALTMTVTAFLPEFIPPVPEPSTLALLGLGAVGLVIRTRRRRVAA